MKNHREPLSDNDHQGKKPGHGQRRHTRAFTFIPAAALLAALLLAPQEYSPVRAAHAQTASGAAGHAIDLRPRLNLDASAAREVTQDRAVAVLYAEQESAEPAVSQSQVSRLLAPALARLKNTADVDVQSSGYRTEPVWQQGRITSWRTRGTLQITGKPSESFNTLVGELATTLNVQSLGYRLSREAHLAAEQELIAQAVDVFRKKAATAAQAMGFRGYEFGEVVLGSSLPPDAGPTPRVAMMAARSDEAVPVPGAEGRTTVTVSLRGNVVLLQ